MSKEMNSGALQASHRSEDENGTYNDMPTKINGKCCFYSSTSCQCLLSGSKYSNEEKKTLKGQCYKNISIL